MLYAVANSVNCSKLTVTQIGPIITGEPGIDHKSNFYRDQMFSKRILILKTMYCHYNVMKMVSANSYFEVKFIIVNVLQ